MYSENLASDILRLVHAHSHVYNRTRARVDWSQRGWPLRGETSSKRSCWNVGCMTGWTYIVQAAYAPCPVFVYMTFHNFSNCTSYTSVNGCMRRSMLTARRMELHADQHQWGCCDGLKHGATHFSVSASFSFADMWVADMLASALKKHTVLSFHYHAAQLTHSSFECLTNGCPPVEVGLLIQCQAGSERVRALE
jgi:hypothetical protein